MKHRTITALAVLALAATSTAGPSRYGPLLASQAGQDTLKNLALWEDQRVTGDGKIFEYLAKGSALVRLRAVEAIGRIQDPIDAPRVIPSLKDRDARVVREAVFSLGQLGSRDAVDPLVKSCAGADQEHRVLVAEALGKLGGEAAIEALNELIRDFDATVRGTAALALARCKDPAAANALLLVVHDPDPNVAWRAIYALEKQEYSAPAAKKLVDFLDDEPPLVRAYAARTLGKYKHGQAEKPLVTLLADSDIRVVVNAARALGEIEAGGAVKGLRSVVIEHESHHARAAAAEALEKIKDAKDAKDALVQALLDKSAMVRIHSTRALAVILRDKSEMFCDQMKKDGERLVRAEAMECYGRAGLVSRLEDLARVASSDSDPSLRAAAVRGLGHLDDDRIPPILVGKLRDGDFTVIASAVEAIGERKLREAAPALVDAYRARADRDYTGVRVEILRVLGALKAPEGSALAREATSDPEKRVRDAAVECLKALGTPVPEIRPDRAFHEERFDAARGKRLGPPLGVRHAVLSCRHGDVEIELFGDDAIATVASFTQLAKKGAYDGLTFHRVVPNFVVQGGDPRGDGWGDAGYSVRTECSQHRYDAGYIGVADDGKDTGGCQFFFTLSPQPHLDGRYTIFGRVTKGMDVVWKIDQGDTFKVRIVD